MAQLSKTLATINTDSPVEFSYEEAKLGNLYTKEAFLLCRQLEFKNLLARFDAEACHRKMNRNRNFLPVKICPDVKPFLRKQQSRRYAGSFSDYRERTGITVRDWHWIRRKFIIFRWRD